MVVQRARIRRPAHLGDKKDIFQSGVFAIPVRRKCEGARRKVFDFLLDNDENPRRHAQGACSRREILGDENRRQHHSRLPRRHRLQVRQTLSRRTLQVFDFRQGRNFGRNLDGRKPFAAYPVVCAAAVFGQKAGARLCERVLAPTLARDALRDFLLGRFFARAKGRAQFAQLPALGTISKTSRR